MQKCKYFKCTNSVTFKIIVINKGKNKGKKRKKAEDYCAKHLKMSDKLDMIPKHDKERTCFYPDCSTILTSLNKSFYCFCHNKIVTFERDGLSFENIPPKNNQSQWDKMMENLI